MTCLIEMMCVVSDGLLRRFHENVIMFPNTLPQRYKIAFIYSLTICVTKNARVEIRFYD